jgi:hypothetical protein
MARRRCNKRQRGGLSDDTVFTEMKATGLAARSIKHTLGLSYLATRRTTSVVVTIHFRDHQRAEHLPSQSDVVL